MEQFLTADQSGGIASQVVTDLSLVVDDKQITHGWSVVAANLAKKGKEAQAISVMFTGMTIANLAGVPIGTYIGHHFSWRITYVIISSLGLLTFLTLSIWLPRLKANKDSNIFSQISYFKRWYSWLIIAIISIGTGGLFAWISYNCTLLQEGFGLDPSRVPYIMILVGLGPCLQMMLINNAKGAETFAAAGRGQAAFNIGNTFGAFFGAIPITMGLAYNYPSLVGAGMASIGALLTFVFLKTYQKRDITMMQETAMEVTEDDVILSFNGPEDDSDDDFDEDFNLDEIDSIGEFDDFDEDEDF
ncbi:hypothetical protein FQR65_LT19373 [Abscondita terminalis]|nr:hypothetical protein FQR65_LT19373 [Abscondita terminalis]